LKSDADLKIAFESGANQINGGSIAVKKQSCIRDDCNIWADKIILVLTQITKSSRFWLVRRI
jgi:phosphoribosylformimino-5-aminoimidazole carboxamide ribotide isomerase